MFINSVLYELPQIYAKEHSFQESNPTNDVMCVENNLNDNWKK